jgi:hypothetical protein
VNGEAIVERVVPLPALRLDGRPGLGIVAQGRIAGVDFLQESFPPEGLHGLLEEGLDAWDPVAARTGSR